MPIYLQKYVKTRLPVYNNKLANKLYIAIMTAIVQMGRGLAR